MPAVVMAFSIAAGSPAAARYISTDNITPSPISGCDLSSCGAPSTLDFHPGVAFDPVFGIYGDHVSIGDFGKIYVYNDGIISLGHALPAGATLGDPGSLGNSYIAAGFADLSGSLAGIAAFSYYGPDGTSDSFGYPNETVGAVDIFWILKTGAIFGVSIGFDCGPTLACLEYGSDANSWYNTGPIPIDPYLPKGALIGFPGRHTTVPGVDPAGFLSRGNAAFQGAFDLNAPLSSGTPEPAAWTMLLLGFGALGASLRLQGARMGLARRRTARLS